jgi:hypothetical protein
MSEPEINKLIQCLETLSGELSPKISLEQAILYLLVCTKEDYPLTQLGERMDWNALKTSRQVNTLAAERYDGREYHKGYEVLYTQEDPESRIFKNAFLTHKGKLLKEQILDILRTKAVKNG